MRNRKFILRICLVIVVSLGCLYAKKGNSQIMPSEGSKLNYTLVGFSVPESNNVTEYEFKVAKGNFKEEKQFQKNVFLMKNMTANKALIKLPSFGTLYTWQVIYSKNGVKSASKLFHFSTDTSSYTNANMYRLRILSNQYADSNLLFFADYCRVAYNLKGEPVWFLPAARGYDAAKTELRDLRLNPQKMVTFVTGTGAYEVDKAGNVQWSKNVKTKTDTSRTEKKQFVNINSMNAFHHEFKKIKNGHYMVLQNDTIIKKLDYLADTSVIADNPKFFKKDDGYYIKIELGKLVEFDQKGNIVWQWLAKDYFTEEELFRKKEPNGIFYAATHMNSFYFNEEDSSVYMGFRDVSHIVRIKYPTKEVIAAYGGNIHNSTDSFFYLQHSCAINKDGNLYVFSNNSKDDGARSTIVIIKEADSSSASAKKIWEFGCDIDNEASHVSTRGGNVVELPDESMICCMGTTNRIFIVDKNKTVLFNALVEKWNEDNKEWTQFPQYRVSPLSMSDYYDFIFK